MRGRGWHPWCVIDRKLLSPKIIMISQNNSYMTNRYPSTIESRPDDPKIPPEQRPEPLQAPFGSIAACTLMMHQCSHRIIVSKQIKANTHHEQLRNRHTLSTSLPIHIQRITASDGTRNFAMGNYANR